MAHLRVEDLWFQYPGGEPVLRGVTLDVPAGDYLALIGQNGAGKTTLAKHLNGIHRPSRGRVLVDGQDARDLSIAALAARVGYCYQNPDHQIFEQTIYDEVAFGPRNQGLRPERVEERVAEALTATGLWEDRREVPHFAGKGERQRIAVAAVLAMRPDVLVLDEPTTGLDWAGAREMMALVDRLHAEGRSILIITHDMRLVADYAWRVVVMGQGQVLADGTPEAIFARPGLLQATALQPPQAARLSLALRPDLLPALTPVALADRLEPGSRVAVEPAPVTAVLRPGVGAEAQETAAAACAAGPEEQDGLPVELPPAFHLHPSARLVAFAVLMVLPFLFQSPLVLAAVLGLTLLTAAATRLPRAGWRLWGALGLVGGLMTFITWLPFMDGGRLLSQSTLPLLGWRVQVTTLSVTWGLAMALRIGAAALASLTYVATTPPRQITMGLGGLGLPYPAAFLVSLAFRLLPVSQHDAATIREAQSVRGLDLSQGSLVTRSRRYAAILGPLVLTALRRVRLIANALDARGFRLRGGRHRLYRMPGWTGTDVLVLAVAVALFTGALYLRSHGVGVMLSDRL